MRTATLRLPVAIVLMASLCLVVGCGGGTAPQPPNPPPPPPPPPPPVEIGLGPGPAEDGVGVEPGLSTLAARNAPYATAPRADAVRAVVLDRLDAVADDPPSTEAELAALLADLTGWVTQDPNDAAAQVGLAIATVFAGAYNAGVEAGYAPGDLLEIFEPVMDLASADDVAPARIGRALVTACLPFAAGGDGRMRHADWFDPSAPDFSSADLQIAIRSLWLPVINPAIERLQAVADNAPGPDVPLVEIGGRRPWRACRAEVNALVGVLRVLKGALLTACAWQLNPAQWDWTRDMAQRDEDGNGRLTVAEYCPPDPFLWRHRSTTMRSGGAALRNGLDAMIAAIGGRRPDSLLAMWINGGAGDERVRGLEDARALIGGTVDVTIGYGDNGPGNTRTVPMNLGRIWDHPVNDVKDLLPVLRIVANPAWQALPRTADDYPDPTLGGVFPQPQPVVSILAAGPRYIEVSYGELSAVIVDRR